MPKRRAGGEAPQAESQPWPRQEFLVRQCRVHEFSKIITVEGYGIFGRQLTRSHEGAHRAEEIPEVATVVHDPTGVAAVKNGPNEAKAASGAFYAAPGFGRKGHLAPAVRNAVTQPGYALLMGYPYESRQVEVIHAASPDFRGAMEPIEEKQDLLVETCRAIMREFARSAQKRWGWFQ